MIEHPDFEYSEEKEVYSTWKNNTPHTAKFRLVTDAKRYGVVPPGVRTKSTAEEINRCQVTQHLTIVIPPGGTKQIASKYDQAIRWVSPNTGEVVQGLCPWLTKIGEEELVVHTSLDYKAAIQNQEALNMVAVLKRKQELEAALESIYKAEEKAKSK